MDGDGINPLALSLDEVIKLNKLRNQEAQQQTSSSHVVMEIEQNGLGNGHVDEDITSSIQNELSENVRQTRTPVHDRLGWIKKPIHQQRYPGRSASQNQVLRVLKNARNFKSRPPVRVVRNNLRGMFPPLTTSVLRKHNQSNGNFTVQRRNGAPSVYSTTTQSTRPSFYRHSIKKSLDPEIQQLIRNMLNDGEPATVEGSKGKMVIDHSLLQNYKPRSDSTGVPTCIRFTMNDVAGNE